MCVHDGIANQACTHAMDAGVTCQGMCVRIEHLSLLLKALFDNYMHNPVSVCLVDTFSGGP